MTVIIKKEFPKEKFIIIKAAINITDRLIFQYGETETEVTVTGVQDQPGMMKNWKVVSWSANGKAE